MKFPAHLKKFLKAIKNTIHNKLLSVRLGVSFLVSLNFFRKHISISVFPENEGFLGFKNLIVPTIGKPNIASDQLDLNF